MGRICLAVSSYSKDEKEEAQTEEHQNTEVLELVAIRISPHASKQ